MAHVLNQQPWQRAAGRICAHRDINYPRAEGSYQQHEQGGGWKGSGGAGEKHSKAAT